MRLKRARMASVEIVVVVVVIFVLAVVVFFVVVIVGADDSTDGNLDMMISVETLSLYVAIE